ncbi:MAG: IS3 family transposase [Candidatus Thiodubiliella endoseptemdiera]|uniref:IS3 family transposase n=1 Tax=Candidatus Thiodubiliella endoseptemdiera TaxID=2738886 RepID=A0A853F2K4_9GAMM|nr:IS3 family transposase [Candidatus Thiodubiliella endoseptemdiera]
MVSKKLKAGLSNLKQLVDFKPSSTSATQPLSINQQCQLLSINRSGLYYTPRTNVRKDKIKSHITKVFEQIPIYGEKKVHQQLLEDGYKVSLNTVARYRQALGLKAVLAVKQVNTAIPIKAHKNTVISFEVLVLTTLIKFGVQTSPTLRLREVWRIWLLLLIGIPRLFYHTEYPTQWIHS